MNRRRADTLVGLLVGLVCFTGGFLSWQAYQQQALDEMGSMMGMSMGSVHGTNPLWSVAGTLLVAAVIGGGYLVVREQLTTVEGGTEMSSQQSDLEGSLDTNSTAPTAQPVDGVNPEPQPTARVLDLLPEDERRVLEPVLSSPGITQIELRDRSDFSKSKVSQTVSALEKRSLLYRGRQGRTYRIYPSDDLQRNNQELS